VIVTNEDKYGQGERIARIIHLLAESGSKSYPELERKFPRSSKATLLRDIKLLKKTKLVVERREARTTDGRISRKTFTFFKDNKDVIGKTRNAMEKLKENYTQITLDLIASHAGLPPEDVKNAAYTLASELGLLIGKDSKDRPPAALLVGAHTRADSNSQHERTMKRPKYRSE
jgi:hypothetical protein